MAFTTPLTKSHAPAKKKPAATIESAMAPDAPPAVDTGAAPEEFSLRVGKPAAAPSTEFIKLKAHSQAQAQAEAFLLLREKRASSLEIFQGDRLVASCEYKAGKGWGEWQQHAESIESEHDRRNDTKHAEIETAARREADAFAHLHEINSCTAPAKKTRAPGMLGGLKKKVENSEFKQWTAQLAEATTKHFQAADATDAKVSAVNAELNPPKPAKNVPSLSPSTTLRQAHPRQVQRQVDSQARAQKSAHVDRPRGN